MWRLYVYVANESTGRLVEDGMSTGLSNTHEECSLMSWVKKKGFPRKNKIKIKNLISKANARIFYGRKRTLERHLGVK